MRFDSLLFGCIYFAVKGVWTHAVAALLLAFATAGISWLIYPFFATQIMRTNYLRRGWIELSDRPTEPLISGAVQSRSNTGRNVLLGILAFFVVVSVASVWFAGKQDTAAKVTIAPISSPPLPTNRPGVAR